MGIYDFVKLYLSALPVFFLVDMIWLGLIANKLYKNELGSLLAKNLNWTAGIIFYLIFIAGIIIFAVIPALEKKDLNHALIFGALFGFFCYATYDLTNLSTLKNWPFNLTIIDMIWGTVLSGLVATVTFWIAVNILKLHA